MIVDDDEDLRETVSSILEDDGYAVTRAAGGAEALALLSAAPRAPDLILLDLMMPGMNGWQFRDRQRRIPTLARIPVMVLTASRSLHLNPIDAKAIVFKPLHVEELLGAVRRAIGP
jgi:CheY-like chemotaxis protein